MSGPFDIDYGHPRDLWFALREIMCALGVIGETEGLTSTMLLSRVSDAVKKAKCAPPASSSSAADMLAADLQALRAEMKKPMEALGQVHKMIIDGVADGSSKAKDRLARVCLWALLGDDDYLTDAADRLALLGPDASGPASGAQQPS